MKRIAVTTRFARVVSVRRGSIGGYQWRLRTNKARAAPEDAFASAVPEDDVLFELPASKRWLRQLTLALTLICRSS